MMERSHGPPELTWSTTLPVQIRSHVRDGLASFGLSGALPQILRLSGVKAKILHLGY